VLAVLEQREAEVHQHQEAHRHSQQSILLAAVEAVMIQPIMLQLAARVAAAVQMLVFQMVRRVTLVVTLQLRVMLVEATPSIKVAHILQVVVVVQVL
jgi:hypothetical protein